MPKWLFVHAALIVYTMTHCTWITLLGGVGDSHRSHIADSRSSHSNLKHTAQLVAPLLGLPTNAAYAKSFIVTYELINIVHLILASPVQHHLYSHPTFICSSHFIAHISFTSGLMTCHVFVMYMHFPALLLQKFFGELPNSMALVIQLQNQMLGPCQTAWPNHRRDN